MKVAVETELCPLVQEAKIWGRGTRWGLGTNRNIVFSWKKIRRERKKKANNTPLSKVFNILSALILTAIHATNDYSHYSDQIIAVRT